MPRWPIKIPATLKLCWHCGSNCECSKVSGFVSVKRLLSTFVAAINVHFIVIGTSLTKNFLLDICYLNHFQPQLLAIHLLLWKFLVIGLGIVRNSPASSLTCRQFLNAHTGAMPRWANQNSCTTPLPLIAMRHRNQFCIWSPKVVGILWCQYLQWTPTVWQVSHLTVIF